MSEIHNPDYDSTPSREPTDDERREIDRLDAVQKSEAARLAADPWAPRTHEGGPAHIPNARRRR